MLQEHAGALAEGRFDIAQEGELAGFWDADRLAQVASNLVGNALEHGDTGRADQGVAAGIASRSRHFLGDQQRRGSAAGPTAAVRSVSRCAAALGRSEGLGLGLYIVQQIVLAHRGRVDVKSDGQRTSFVVQLPRRSRAEPRVRGATSANGC